MHSRVTRTGLLYLERQLPMYFAEMTLEESASSELPAEKQPAAPERRPPIYQSAELLQGCQEAWIEHGEQMYRLRLTHAGKLYLTK